MKGSGRAAMAAENQTIFWTPYMLRARPITTQPEFATNLPQIEALLHFVIFCYRGRNNVEFPTNCGREVRDLCRLGEFPWKPSG